MFLISERSTGRIGLHFLLGRVEGLGKTAGSVSAGKYLQGMDGALADCLLELNCGQRAVRGQHRGFDSLHLLEGLLTTEQRDREELLAHRPGAIVAAALL